MDPTSSRGSNILLPKLNLTTTIRFEHTFEFQKQFSSSSPHCHEIYIYICTHTLRILQIHNNVLMIFYGIFSYFKLECELHPGIFHGILLVPHNTVMNMIIVMSCKSAWPCEKKLKLGFAFLHTQLWFFQKIVGPHCKCHFQ